MPEHSILDCLQTLTIEKESLVDCDSLNDEFKLIKKTYFALILQQHPDKGGDPETFRQTQVSFEVLRNLHQSGKVRDDTFVSYFSGAASVAADFETLFQQQSTEVPSYEYYAAAAEEEVPPYFVELAKSGRSKCVVVSHGSCVVCVC